jgi:hypothetical protein
MWQGRTREQRPVKGERRGKRRKNEKKSKRK